MLCSISGSLSISWGYVSAMCFAAEEICLPKLLQNLRLYQDRSVTESNLLFCNFCIAYLRFYKVSETFKLFFNNFAIGIKYIHMFIQTNRRTRCGGAGASFKRIVSSQSLIGWRCTSRSSTAAI